MKLKLAAGIVFAVAAVVGFVLLVHHCDAARSGDPTGASLVDGKDGPELVLYNTIGNDDDPDEIQVTTVDARTGARLGGRRFSEAGVNTCWTAAAGRLWCDFGRLALHDARTLDTVLAFDDAIAEAKLGRPMRDQYATDSAHAWMQLDDGRVARLDATTLAVAIDETPPDHGQLSMMTRASSDISTSAEVELGGMRWTIGGGPRAAILRGDGPPTAPRPTFLSPQFVTVDNEPLAIDGDPVIVYGTSLDPARDRAQLARIGGDGAAVWSLDVGGGLELIARQGNLLIVATGTTDARALAIDPQTGAVRWRFEQ